MHDNQVGPTFGSSTGPEGSLQPGAPLFMDQSQMTLQDSNVEANTQHAGPSSAYAGSFQDGTMPGSADPSHQSHDFSTHQTDQYPSRPPTASDQRWSDQMNAPGGAQLDGISGALSTVYKGQRVLLHLRLTWLRSLQVASVMLRLAIRKIPQAMNHFQPHQTAL